MRGFNNRAFADKIVIINIRDLDSQFNDGDTITVESLRAKGLIHGQFDGVKLLAEGETTKKFHVQVHRFSASAEEKITQAGGQIVPVV